ncbi:MAG: hypothetical protein L3K17_02095 [Thermoplasmata archaeon]|nr:hypothetical protein [Thermoplasmata archaeon]
MPKPSAKGSRKGPGAAPPPAGPAQREVLRLLARDLLPALRRAGAKPLAKAVLDAVDAGDPRLLARLPERQRRELLEYLEGHIARSRRGISPRAVVGVTAAVLADSLPSDSGMGRRLASPAR